MIRIAMVAALLGSTVLGVDAMAVAEPRSTALPPMTHLTVSPAAAAKFNAKCLQGTPPTFELRTNAKSDKWLLFLEGGGEDVGCCFPCCCCFF